VGEASEPASASVDLRATLSRSPGHWALLGIDVVGTFVFGGLGVLTVVLSSDVYGAGDAGTGYLNAAIGVGGVLAGLFVGALALRPSLGPPLVLGATMIGLGVVVLGAVNTLAIGVAMAVTATGNSSSR
jgi:hypothetical protein